MGKELRVQMGLEGETADEKTAKHAEWWPHGKTAEPVPVTCKSYKVSGNYTGLIKSWKVHKAKFMIKRLDGIQYFKRSFNKLSTLPKGEINRLAQLNLINPYKDDNAEFIQSTLRKEVKSKRYKFIKPTLGTRYTSKKKLDPVTRQPIYKVHYPPAACLNKIPLEMIPLNLLRRFHYWELDAHTGEAVFVFVPESEPETGSLWGLKKVQFRVFDPMSLINLSEKDLRKLFDNRIRYNEKNSVNKTLATQFQRIVNICVTHGIHAGGKFPAGWV